MLGAPGCVLESSYRRQRDEKSNVGAEKTGDFNAKCECGALGGTRTPTVLPTATSRQRVYQFRHEREDIDRPKGPSRINGADVTNRPWGDKARAPLKSRVLRLILLRSGGLRLKSNFPSDLKLFLPVQSFRKK